MDGGDQDFGSGGIALLDPTVFKGTGVSKMAVTGKLPLWMIVYAQALWIYITNKPSLTDSFL